MNIEVGFYNLWLIFLIVVAFQGVLMLIGNKLRGIKIENPTKLALYSLKFVKIPFIGSLVGKELLKRIRKFEPKLIDMNTASKLIQESKKCAIGERVCRAIHKNSEHTESVFLDELAEGLAEVGKARYVTKEEAINTLKKYNNPLILSKVSNKHMEICLLYTSPSPRD